MSLGFTKSSLAGVSVPTGLLAWVRAYWATLIVFGLTAMISLVFVTQEYDAANEQANRELQESMRGVSEEVIEKFDHYEDALNTVRGFVDASNYVSRDEWNTFFRSASLGEQFPGVFGFSLVQRVKREDLDGFLASTREEVAGFEIHYPHDADHADHAGDLYVIKYTTPDEKNGSTLGLDLASKLVNKEVYDLAARNNGFAVSRPLHLHQDNSSQWGVVMAMPLYTRDPSGLTGEQREEASTGWVASPIGIDNFFASDWDASWDAYRLSLFASRSTVPGSEVYRSGASHSGHDESCALMVSTGFSFGGRPFTLSICPGDTLVADPDFARAHLVSTTAAFFAILLTGVVYMSSRTGIQARKIALEMTKSLRKKDTQQRSLVDQANAANESKSGFLANMSHEIRTPLTAVLGYAEVLGDQIRDHSDANDLHRSLDCIHRSGEHLRSIINDVLDLSKIDAGKIDIHPRACNLPDLIRDVADSFLVRAGKKNLTLDVFVESAIPEEIIVDELRVRQVLINLIGNAVKFTDTGSVSVGVRYEDDSLSLCISDTGVGIKPEMMKTLFRPFEQADSTMTRRHEGTGLGLTISRKIARLMHGDIDADSKLGSGSTFIFWFPIRVDEDTEMIETISGFGKPAQPQHTQAIARVNGRVLLVEDGIDNQRLISHFLRKVGLRVEFASNGQLAVDLLEQDSNFDVILMDMQMPVMDGYSATRALRARGCVIPIIALTAHAMRGDREKCINAGCTDYLAKPIDRELMITTIAGSIGPRTSQPHAA